MVNEIVAVKKPLVNRRTWTLTIITAAIVVLLGIVAAGIFMSPEAYATNFENKNQPPSFSHLFGTDWMGRDMFARTIKGLSTSILIGVLAAGISSVIAVIMGTFSAVMGKKADQVVLWLIDMVQGIPHLILLMLISFMLGKGLQGVMIGIAITHWPNLARIVRAEVMAVKNGQFVQASRKMGRSRMFIAVRHILPHVIPQYIVGLILLFPHAILHEASITFLGFGLSPEQPAVGVILSESMRYLTSGFWWLTVLPGAALLAIVLLFDAIGDNLRTIIDPYSAQE
ncbi:ABC transporter permease [Desulfosporosinus youngiae]|uniref:ABC-type dipeptide/oligopeptide/nickel transport system, permease component n=1 Tax=Desulfosporosinus youngiae DSM 17734 TaxID=768710 RepID=H5Y660_9FIRM|nr:ABC transporter permease [Desulfosporosinus youngiae]EHQ91070.1 ABC-type dipeptide/oligopeptide/nickel transport system, permease component [Desulfosporosinus youngiae DSM 17734]